MSWRLEPSPSASSMPLFLFFIVLLPFPLCAQIVPQPTEPPSAPTLTFHGALHTRYRVRWTGEESDQDIDQYVSIEAGDPLRDPVTGAVSLRLNADLDSGGDRAGHHEFEDIFDTFEGHVTTLLYSAHADLHQVPGCEVARIGRQLLYETPEVFHFDGARVESVELDTSLRLRLGAYAGIPVHLYESSARGDIIAGGFASSEPWRGGRIRLDAVHVEDEVAGETEKDDLIGIALTQRFDEGWSLALSHTRLDGASRDLEARGDYIAPERDLQVQLLFYDQPTTRHAATPELDPFSSALHDIAPHTLWSAAVHQGLGEAFTASVGYARRDLVDQSDESPFNHEYSRGFATLSFDDWPWEGAGGFITADDWDSTGDSSRTFSGGLSQDFGRRVRVSVGSAYSLYEYDYLLEEERQQVRTFYVNVEGPMRGRTRLRIGYEYERDPFDEYHVVTLRLTHTF